MEKRNKRTNRQARAYRVALMATTINFENDNESVEFLMAA